MRILWLSLALVAGLFAPASARLQQAEPASARTPEKPGLKSRPPETFRVRLVTTKGDVVIACVRAWAPRGADRFHELVQAGYYDDSALFRVIEGRFAQFGINGDPAVSAAWRERRIPDDPFRQSNVRGTVAFAFAEPDGRTTQVFINLRDNSEAYDKEPFVPFGRVVEGMDVVDAWYAGYGAASGGGIRAGQQAPLFEQGNAYLGANFPKLDYIRSARVER